jgi:hypothetical protein
MPKRRKQRIDPERRAMALSAAVGLAIGLLDIARLDARASIILLVTAGLAFAAWSPRRFWLWGLLVGAGVPLVWLVADAFGYRPLLSPTPALGATVLSFVPAMLAAWCGTVVAVASNE